MAILLPAARQSLPNLDWNLSTTSDHMHLHVTANSSPYVHMHSKSIPPLGKSRSIVHLDLPTYSHSIGPCPANLCLDSPWVNLYLRYIFENNPGIAMSNWRLGLLLLYTGFCYLGRCRSILLRCYLDPCVCAEHFDRLGCSGAGC